MKILLVADSQEELRPIIAKMDQSWEKVNPNEYKSEDLSVQFLIGGHTQFQMIFNLCNFKEIATFDRVINIGLAAGNTRILDIGQTVNIGRDIFGDIGLEESDGNFKDLFDLKLADSAKLPFFRAEIFNEDIINPLKYNVVKSISLNTIPGTFENIERLNKKYHADTISRTGAAFAFSCKMLNIKYLQLRTVYRYLEPSSYPYREKEMAIIKLGEDVFKFLDHISFEKKNLLNLFDN